MKLLQEIEPCEYGERQFRSPTFSEFDLSTYLLKPWHFTRESEAAHSSAHAIDRDGISIYIMRCVTLLLKMDLGAQQSQDTGKMII